MVVPAGRPAHPPPAADMRPCRHTVGCLAYPEANQGQHAVPPLWRLCTRIGCAHHLLHTPLQEGGQPRLVILLQTQLLLEDHLHKGRNTYCSAAEQGNSFCAHDCPLAAVRLLLQDQLQGAIA